MIIALDYDNTFTLDKTFWRTFVKSCTIKSHKVFIVTARGEEDYEDELKFHNEWTAPVILCNGRPKKEVCEELGIKIDIWIEDNPETIIHGSSYTPEMLVKWRENGRR